MEGKSTGIVEPKLEMSRVVLSTVVPIQYHSSQPKAECKTLGREPGEIAEETRKYA